MRSDTRLFAVAMALLLVCQGTPSDATARPVQLNRDPAIRHGVIEEGRPSPRVDTGSVLELSEGKLLLAYQRGDDGGGLGDHSIMRVWTRVSFDGGRTWFAPRLVVDVSPGDITVGMPALLRLKSGDILMTCLVHHTLSSSTMLLYRSCDEGRTFTAQPSVWERSRGIQLQGGAPSLVLLQSGRILLPTMFGLPGKDTRKLDAGCYTSDDDGKTWRATPARITLPRRGALEPSVAELASGQLVMSLRTQLGGPYLSHSFDQGESWSAPEPAGWDPVIKGPTLESGESCTVLRRIPGADALLLLWNNTPFVSGVPGYRGHFGRRSPLTAAVSSDAGKTWVIAGNLASDPDYLFTNLGCTFLSDGQAVVTYYAYNRTTPWPEPPQSNQTALCIAFIEPSWFQAAIDRAAELAKTAPPAYRPPG